MPKLLMSILAVIMMACSAFVSAQKLPELSLQGLDGKKHSIQEFLGKNKWVIINIWGPKCPPCVAEMPELQSFHDDHKDNNAIVVGIALDYPSFGPANEQEVRQFAEDNFISFPLLLGDAKSIEHLGAGPLAGTPTTLLFDPSGKLDAMQVGQITQQLIEDYLAKTLKQE